MGERFYHQQKLTVTDFRMGIEMNKPKKRLKADIIKSVNAILDLNLKSFTGMTVPDLTALEAKLIELGKE